jgi:hypothetical protein
MPAKGAQTAGQRASGLPLALLDHLAGLEDRSAQLNQLLLERVVGGLQRLGPIGRMPQRGAQAWTTRAKEIKKGNGPPKGRSTKQEMKWQLTFNLLLFHLESPALGLDCLL